MATATPEPTQPPIEVDEISDTDSAIDFRSLASSTTSIGSSILKSREENGRTYHAYKDGKYVYPDDENEKDRLDRKLCFLFLFLSFKIFPYALRSILHFHSPSYT